MKSRMIVWMLTGLIFLSAGQVHAQGVVVNEVMSNVRGTDSGVGSPGDRNEFVELFNSTDNAVDLSSYRISDLDASDDIEAWADSLILDQDVLFGTTMLAPGSYAVILDPEYTDTGDGSYCQPYDFPEQTLVVTVGNTTIGNGLSSTDPIVLIDASDDTVSSYGTPNDPYDGIPFDPGDGVSAERVSPYVVDHELNWVACSDSIGCTPGGPNSTYGSSELAIPLHGFSVSPDHVAPNELVTISVLVQNQTEDTVKTADIDLFVDEGWDSLCWSSELIGTIVISEPIPPYGCSTRIQTDWTPEDEGNKRIGVKLSSHEKAACFRMLKVGKPIGEIIINEIMYRPDNGGEWIELFNRSPFSIDIGKWRLGVGEEKIVMTSELATIEPGSSVVIVEDRSQFYSKWGNVAAAVIEPAGWIPLSNGGDILLLEDAQSFTFEQARYDDITGPGESIERISPGAASNEAWNWGCSVDYRGGTPGERNSIFAESTKEKTVLSVHPNPFSPNGDGYEERAFIRYELPFLQAKVNLLLYTKSGVRKCNFIENEETGKTGQYIWDGCDDNGKEMPVGLYIVYLEAVDRTSNERVVQKAAIVIAGRR
jgi:hypothetical protein